MNDLTNQVFGRLTVKYPTDKRENGHIIWVCECSCGNLKEVSNHSLQKGDNKSCGCWRREA